MVIFSITFGFIGGFYAKIAAYRALKRLTERIFSSVPDP
jgi:hypothetical protein